MYKIVIAAITIGAFLLVANASFSQTDTARPSVPSLTNGTSYALVSERGTAMGRACAYKWYSGDKKTYLLLTAVYRSGRGKSQRELLLQVGDATKNGTAPTSTLRLNTSNQISGLLETLKYEADSVRATREPGIGFNAVNDGSDDEDGVQSTIGASVLETGESTATIDFATETGSCEFTFSPKEQYLDFVAKYEALTVWLAKQQ